MKNYFQIDLMEVDKENIWHNVYVIIDTPNPASEAMKHLLGGYLNVLPSSVKNISQREFELKIQEERIIDEIQ